MVSKMTKIQYTLKIRANTSDPNLKVGEFYRDPGNQPCMARYYQSGIWQTEWDIQTHLSREILAQLRWGVWKC